MVIDQSGRVEETNRVTVIALANKSKSFTVALLPKTKKELQAIFRKKGKPKVFPVIVFATIVFITMLRSKTYPQELIIDIEYPGHENAIKNIVTTLCRRFKKKPPEIYFSNIGKKDPAHLAAWKTYNKKLKSNLILKIGDFKGIVSLK